jgi:hypothetical protein
MDFKVTLKALDQACVKPPEPGKRWKKFSKKKGLSFKLKDVVFLTNATHRIMGHAGMAYI